MGSRSFFANDHKTYKIHLSCKSLTEFPYFQSILEFVKHIIKITRICDDYECIATRVHLTPHQSFSTLITTPMPSLKSLNLSVSVFMFIRYVALCS